MTVSDLIAQLQKYPGYMQVVIQDCDSEAYHDVTDIMVEKMLSLDPFRETEVVALYGNYSDIAGEPA